MSTQRIQLHRTKGWRKPEGAIVVSRPSRWGNPYRVGDLIRDPVSSFNPVPTTHLSVFDSEGAFVRRAFDGSEYAVTIRRVADAADAVELFRRWHVFEGFDLRWLRGHDLACWCPLDRPCHADVLLELANRQPMTNLDEVTRLIVATVEIKGEL